MAPANPDVSSFVFKEDPARDPKEGDTLRFEQLQPQFEATPRFADITNWQAFEGILLAVMSSADSDHSILGSAVMVAPGIALTATHNLENLLPALTPGGGMSMMCVGIASTGAQAWTVKFATCIGGTDLCILGLEYATDIPSTRKFYEATLTTRVPAIGERLVMAGFRAASDKFERRADRSTELSGSLYVSSGIVTERYMESRDSVKIPWPTLEVDCPTLGGMSGGPVFDSRGFLVGMVTSSFECADEPSPTYTALLWKLFGQKFKGGWPAALVGSEPKSFLDLHDRHLCQIERPSAVQISLVAGQPTLTYSPTHLLTYSLWS